MTDSDRGAPSVDLAVAAVPAPRGAAEAPGAWHDAYPGDTHWYDLPDDDAAPEEDEPLTLVSRLRRALRAL